MCSVERIIIGKNESRTACLWRMPFNSAQALFQLSQLRGEVIVVHEVTEMAAVESIRPHDLVSDVDFGGEYPAEQRLLQLSAAYLIEVLGQYLA